MTLSVSGPRRIARRTGLLAFAAFGCAWAAGACLYTVQPTELAAVRRLGTVVSAAPIGPGLHTKLPLIDQVDRLQVSLTRFGADGLTVYTVDNQPVTIGVGLTYRIPPRALFQLLYGVGRSGNVDIEGTLRPIVADRALRVFARHNTIQISKEREQIAGEIHAEVSQAVASSFGLDIVDLQLSRIEYSPAFLESVEQAVRAKAAAVQAENTVARVRYEGEQARVQAEAEAAAGIARANGEAAATLARARAARDAAVLKAEGEAKSVEMVGAAEARALQLAAGALGGGGQAVAYAAARRWNGALPTTMPPGGTVPFLTVR